MIALLLPVVLFFAGPFWETKAPAQWTDVEVASLMFDSPWAKPAVAAGKNVPSPVQTYLATAGPVYTAEQERTRRARAKHPDAELTEEDAMAQEYRDWLESNRATQIVLAVQVGNTKAFSEEKEVSRMEDECIMRVGRKKVKITGHFPPTPGDPYLRLAFPRQEIPGAMLTFELYLPGVSIPYRTVQFKLADMQVGGKLEL